MAKQTISSGSEFESLISYSRAVVTPPWIFVSGTTGYDYATGRIPESVTGQAEQALRNIDAALRLAGSTIDDVVRVRYILPDRRDFPAIWPILRKWFGDAKPAATMVQAGLMEECMKVEVEVTARKGAGTGQQHGREGANEGQDSVPMA
jgi:2-iminobutanoate/2-iminopropanoate deaminase